MENRLVTAGSPSGAPEAGPPDDPLAKVRKWWLRAVFFSVLGSGMVALANAYIVYDQTQSVAITGLLAVCGSLPPLLLPAAATALAQRFGGPRTYIVRFLLSAVVGFVPVVLLTTGLLTTVTLLIWWAAMSVIGGLFSPSRTLVQRMLAPPELLPELNAAVSRNFSLASVIGILGGGLVFASIGASWVYAINALSFLPLILPVIPLLGIPGPGAAEAQKRRFRDALSLLYGPNARRDLLSACRFSSLNLAIGGYTITFPAIARSVSTHVGILSVLQATALVGGISTVAVMRWLPQRMGWGRVQRGCFLAVGTSVLLLAWSAESGNAPAVTLVVGILAVLPLGFALSLDRVILSALVQMRTPPQSRAEFFTYYALIPMVAVPVGQMVIGALADQTSVSVALAAVAAVTLVLVALGPRLRQRAGFDELTLEDSSRQSDPGTSEGG